MARQAKVRAVEAAAGPTQGDLVSTKGHPQIGILVIANGFEEGDEVTVRLDAMHEGEGDDVSAPVVLVNPGANNMEVTHTDLEDINDDGTATAFGVAHNIPAEYVRPRIVDMTGDFTVDVWIYSNGWSGPARSYREQV